MNKIMKYSLSIMAFAMTASFGACTDLHPDTPELPDLPTVNNLKAEVANRVVTLSWQLPSTSMTIEGVTLRVNNSNPINLEPTTTSYTVLGQPMQDEYMYTVKVNYKDGYVSEGKSVIAVVPYEELPNVSNLEVTNIEGRKVTLAWTLPNVSGITGVLVGIDGEDVSTYSFFEGNVTTVTLKSQPSNTSLRYRVLVQYDNYYNSDGSTCPADIPYVETKMGYLLLASSPAALEDDDERAAAAWFSDQNNAEFITLDQLPDLDPEEYSVLWIMVDRVGLEFGWQNLPDGLASESTIEALKKYGANGGNLYLAKMATQLTVPLNIVPESMAPTIFSSGEGGEGGDIWTINPYLGWDFQGSDIEFYDRTAHKVYAGLTFEQVNDYPYVSLPLEGPGMREDHNTMWDCNIYGNGGYNNVILNFEITTNSLVLATWGHVRDHCVAGLVDFNPVTDVHGRVIANGFSAYEFNQNSGANLYQHNVEKLTENILNYLK